MRKSLATGRLSVALAILRVSATCCVVPSGATTSYASATLKACFAAAGCCFSICDDTAHCAKKTCAWHVRRCRSSHWHTVTGTASVHGASAQNDSTSIAAHAAGFGSAHPPSIASLATARTPILFLCCCCCCWRATVDDDAAATRGHTDVR